MRLIYGFIFIVSLGCISLSNQSHAQVVDCGAKDDLNWAEVSPGEKGHKQKYLKSGLATTISSRSKAGVSSSLKVGKRFKNKSTLEWSTVGAKKGVTSEVALAFSVSPNQFSFSLNDVDKEGSDLIDSLVVSAYSNGNLVDLSIANIVSIGSAVTFSGNNSFTGILNANDATSDEGNVSINYFIPIDSIVLSINNASPTAKMNSIQQVGVGNLEWCPLPNTAPIIVDRDGNPATIIRDTTRFNEPLKLCVSVIDIDSVYVTQIVPIQNYGSLAMISPDTCLTYTPVLDFIGEESFQVTWCDNRVPSLCTQAEVIVTVLPPVEALPILVAEGLSPNGDDILDTWIIQGIERYPDNYVRVFNIWGDLVFEQRHYNNELNSWRGETNRGTLTSNQRMPDGTYYYILSLGDGSNLLKGFVMLKR